MAEAPAALSGLSSMATRQVLAALAGDALARGLAPVRITSIGGVDAEQRVMGGEAVDLVWLAAPALDRLQAGGHLVQGSLRALMRSEIWVAVREGAPRPAIGDADQVREAVLAARTLGYSTGPSGTYLSGLFQRWGIWDQVQSRLVKAPPGVPVGALIARGEVELGFQQRSELVGLDGVDAMGPLPEAIQHTTVFSGAVCIRSQRPEAAAGLLDFMASADAAGILLAHGMAPA
jgi:molybdate transport system substrate-binding protein